jgi:anti-sigma factor RsiW
MDTDSRTEDEGLLRRYLLGGLPEAEREPLEGRLFSEDEFLEHLALVEDDLIDSYVCDELAPGDRERFESHFLASPRHRERVEFARSLGSSVHNQVSSPPEPVRPRQIATWRSFVARFTAGMWAPAFAAAMAAVLITGAVMIPFYSRLTRQATETREQARQIADLRAEVAKKPVGTPQPPEASGGLTAPALTAALSFVLNPGTLRSAVQPEQRLAIPAGERSVQLLLAFKGAPAYPRYRVVIQDLDGREVWGQEQPAPARSGTAPLLKLTVPASALRPGDYRINVAGITASGELEELQDYFVFSVSGR